MSMFAYQKSNTRVKTTLEILGRTHVATHARTHARTHTCLNAHECKATTLLINTISSVKLTVWEYLFYALTNMAFDLLE